MKLVKKSNLNLNLWITFSLSVLSLVAQANTPAPATTTSTATASTTPATTTTASTATTTAAAAPAAVSTTAAPKKEEPPKVSFGITYEAGYSMQAETQSDGTRSQTLTHGFTPKMSYGEYSAKLILEYEQDLVDSKSSAGFSNPTIAVGKKPWTLGKYFSLAPSASLIFPMKEASKNEETLMYNIGGALGLNLNTKAMGLDRLSVGYQLAAAKNFTDYDTNAKTGNPNNSHRIRNRFTLGFQITDAISFFNMFDFNSSYSVNGVVTNSYLSLQSLGYSINDNVSVSVSHVLGGPYLKAGTYENNLKFYDSKESQLGLGLEVSL